MPTVKDVEFTWVQSPNPCPGTCPGTLHRQLAHDGAVWLVKGYLTVTVKFQSGEVVTTSRVHPCWVWAELRQSKTYAGLPQHGAAFPPAEHPPLVERYARDMLELAVVV